MRRFPRLSLLIAALLPAAACESGTAPDPVTLRFEVVRLESEAERIAWPSTPTVQGGPTIVVRGQAFLGCGETEALAQRAGSVVDVLVRIRPGTEGQPCLAIYPAWMPFRAEVLGLDQGEYRVRARASGHAGIAEFRVRVDPNLR